MGMRIKTAIGYGLSLDGLDRYWLSNRWSNEDGFDALSQTIVDDILTNKPKDRSKSAMTSDHIFFGPKSQEERPFSLEKHIFYDDEFFMPDHVLIHPFPFGEKWSRSDDDIDYFRDLTFQGDEALQPIWKETKRAIYPYTGLMRPNPEWHLGIESYMESCYMDGNTTNLTAFVPLQIMFVIKHLFRIPEEELISHFMRITPVYARWWS